MKLPFEDNTFDHVYVIDYLAVYFRHKIWTYILCGIRQSSSSVDHWITLGIQLKL